MRYSQDPDILQRREMRKLRHKNADRRLLIFLGVIGLLFVVLMMLFPVFQYTREVNTFTSTLEKKSPSEVKKELQTRFVPGLTSGNPLIRIASMTALRAATGWRLGSNATEWRKWWDEHEATWVYKSDGNTNQLSPDAAVPK